MPYTPDSNVKHLTSLEELNDLISIRDKLTVVDFHAPWCGPCRAFEPVFEEIAEKVPEIQFAKVNIEVAKDIALRYKVASLPTFIYFKNGKKVDISVGVGGNRLFHLIKLNTGLDISTRIVKKMDRNQIE
ncbi:Thioredoxin (Trx) [Scheffersomyces stipitis CBS 6054]|uniref:Thioredoxin (Trx) n=1 Tax=Scheffersomyces stipitis (strain ATCC 58785 / CBS 6054 / NBRC 10063 / NRRL Y-11545) TaxID=322104 RepID=A3LUN7_PICST|nr:Thioredoxin (Trx) [Scheffersomyces stipitis CBS 6054]ABN66625.2 Thioredoxin (Trx) [Scheffersomyces stipitis CBS 6054]KAG2733142.1 hypothetical protein G9P44_004132 [Scheffersomyces stipitis]